MDKAKPATKDIAAAIHVLQMATKGLGDTEIVISDKLLRVLPGSYEFDLRSPAELIKCLDAVRFLQGIYERDSDMRA